MATPRGGATTAAAQVDVEDSQPDAAPQGAHNEESSSEASKDDVVEVEVEDVKEEAKDAAEMLIELNLTDRHDVAERCSDMPDSFEGPTQLLAWSMCGPIGDNENHITLTATSQPLPTRKALREDVREANRSSSSKGAPASSTDSSSHSTPQGRSSGASTPLGPAASHVAHEQRERFFINQTTRNQTAHSIASAMHRMQRMSELNMLMQMGEPEAQEPETREGQAWCMVNEHCQCSRATTLASADAMQVAFASGAPLALYGGMALTSTCPTSEHSARAGLHIMVVPRAILALEA